MNLSPDEEEEFRDLLETLCEERTTPEQIARLEQMVLADPRAEENYITYMTLQAGLRWKLRGLPLVPPVYGGNLGTQATRLAWRSQKRLSWTIAIAVGLFTTVAIGLSILQGLGVSRSPTPVRMEVAGKPTRSGAGPGDVSATNDEPVAVVAQTLNARWELGDGPSPVRGRAVGTGRIRLASGTATFAFLNGVMLTLEGPADIDLVSVDRVFCRRGRLRTRVPKGAEGFIVASPSSAVVDLGTEFAMNLEHDGHAQVMVFEGTAETALLGTGGVPKLTQTVHRSEAFELNPASGRIDVSAAEPDRFVAAPSISAGTLSLDARYGETVLAARPRGYWRFESLDEGVVRNEVAGGSPLRANGPVRVVTGEGRNGYVTFGPGAPEQFLTADSLFELNKLPGHAVEFWFQADRYLHASLIGFIPPEDFVAPEAKDPYVHAFLVEVTAQQRQTLNKPASVRFLHRWPIDYRLGNNLFSDRNYVPWVWHHVVAQRVGDRMELYLDGASESTVPLETDHPKLACRLVVGRRAPDPSDLSDARPFVGRLDELAVYDHPLSSAEVRSHFLLAKPNHGPE